MQAGKLVHRAVIYRPADTSELGTRGEETAEPIKVGRAMVGIDTLSGDELEMAQKQWSYTTHRLRMRYRRDVDSSHWLEVQARNGISEQPRKFSIGRRIDPDQKAWELQLLCREES